MFGLSATAYLTIKALHVIAMVSWMAGLFYLPRLFVYHSVEQPGSATSELFKVMERRLLRAIMHPAAVATVLFGAIMLGELGWDYLKASPWLHVKLATAFLLLVFHGFCMRWRADFAADRNTRPQRFYRFANEVPTLLMIVIVVMAIVKPFG